jgi:hypothetical protein
MAVVGIAVHGLGLEPLGDMAGVLRGLGGVLGEVTSDSRPVDQPVRSEGQQWLRPITHLLDGRLTLAEHQEVLPLAGWLALLVGCLEYDMGLRVTADTTRKAALSLGSESGKRRDRRLDKGDGGLVRTHAG